MTVAAVILAATPASALADADGMPSVRRIADVAWAGGAVPLVVVAADPDGAVASALAGAPVTLAEPVPAAEGPAAQMARGVEVAVAEVAETRAALLWPARMTWVGPETATSLMEAHGTDPGVVLRPAFEGAAGWPALLPVALLSAVRAVRADRSPEDVLSDLATAGVTVRAVDLGDPGTIHDLTTPRADLPPYAGPVVPAAGHVHEWGAAVADQPHDAPLAGPSLAPYGQAAATDPDQPG